jgi:hypothetical protein
MCEFLVVDNCQDITEEHWGIMMTGLRDRGEALSVSLKRGLTSSMLQSLLRSSQRLEVLLLGPSDNAGRLADALSNTRPKLQELKIEGLV